MTVITSGYYSYFDAVKEVLDYIGSKGVDESGMRDAKRSVIDAVNLLASGHTWTYYYQVGRLNLNAPYAAGSQSYNGSLYPSCSYDYTGGTYERQLTMDAPPSGSGFSQATWPTWAADAYIRFNNVLYRVDERKSSTVLTLTEELCPVVDFASGSLWTSFYQDTYLLPEDFRSGDRSQYEVNLGQMTYLQPKDWLSLVRYADSAGQPSAYTIMGDSKYPTRLVMRVMPYPTEAKTVDFIYQRNPRELKIYSYSTGTATVTAGSNTITGSGTSWDSTMEGSVIRISSSTTVPTSKVDSNPYVFETQIVQVVGSTSMRVLDTPDTSYTSVGYQISDPVDINVHSMLRAFKRACEYNVSLKRILPDKPSAVRLYEMELAKAKDADSPNFSRRTVGTQYIRDTRLARQPYSGTGGNVYD